MTTTKEAACQNSWSFANDTVTDNITLYAKWTKDSSGGQYPIYYTLSFQTNGGSDISPVTTFAGVTIDLATYVPTREGFTFGGWYSDRGLTTAVTSVTLYSDRIVYASWKSTGEIENPDYGSDLNMEDHFAFPLPSFR